MNGMINITDQLFREVRQFPNIQIDGTTTAAEQTDNIVMQLLQVLKEGIPGDVVEFGCYLGETSKFLKRCLMAWHSQKRLYVYDSFEGLPALGDHEKGTGWTQGGFSNTSEDILIYNFLDNKMEPPTIVKGWFKDVQEKDIPKEICFAFLDGDFYASIYDSLTHVWPRLSDGGCVLFHDYGRGDLPGVKAAVDDYFVERRELVDVVVLCDQLAVIKKGGVAKPLAVKKDPLTVVTGLWNIKRFEEQDASRHFIDHYIQNFQLLLKVPCNMFIYIEKEYEHYVWEVRSQHNTFVKIYELEDVKKLYNQEFWDKTQKIRTDPKWLEGSPDDWLKRSPQALLEYYNPVVQSKVFMMHDVTIWNPFASKYFLWLDAGLTNTVGQGPLIDRRFYDNVIKYMDPFIFLSFKYDVEAPEIHGMKRDYINSLAGEPVAHVCRGGIFGGTKKAIHYAHNASYYGLVQKSLTDGYMGTEESLFAVMSYLRPNYFRRYELPGTNVTPFVQDVIEDKAAITGENVLNKEYHEDWDQTAIYFLVFNKPKQIEGNLKYIEQYNPDWLKVKHKYVIDNSTDLEAKKRFSEICKKYGFVHIPMHENTGIAGGRQYVAEHFDKLGIEYYVFFEDDMHLNGSDLEGKFCRNGLRRYVPNLWNAAHGIMVKDDLDYLKLTFTEVFLDNNEQVSWYNVDASVRESVWPHYKKLPVHNFDPNCPRTQFEYIDRVDELAYGVGQVYYCNWPILFSKEGNKKVFLDKKINPPSERAQMAYVFERQLRGEIKAGVLLASTITHDRKEIYADVERKEG